MGSVGRNEPCPCGSGKKYKRCCLRRDEQTLAESPDAHAGGQVAEVAAHPPDSAGLRGMLPPMRPYAMVQMGEDSPQFERMRERDPKQWAMRTVEGVAALSIEVLRDRLTEMGIDASRETFIAAAAGERSAWDVSLGWLGGRPKSSLPRFAEDFAGLAACRLWEEYLPERPSIEMVDDWMQEGYRLGGESGPPEVCELWWKVWEYVQERVASTMRNRESVDAMYQGMQSIYNWTQDFTLALINASIGDSTWTERGIEYHRELLERFPDDDQHVINLTRADLAELLIRAGQRAEGEGILRALVAEHPDRSVGYCRLADELQHEDPEQALALLLEARDRPVEDVLHSGIEDRIETVRAIVGERGS